VKVIKLVQRTVYIANYSIRLIIKAHGALE
jgi:hypothetical protein